MKQELVNNYFKTIGFNKQIKNIEDINELMRAHLKTLPFASLKVLLKDEISLNIEAIYESIVIQKRAGYCFEHNKLLYEVLKEQGFDVEFYLARVINNLEKEVPQTHRFTLLNFKGDKYLLDVGIGFRTPSVAVKFGDEITSNHLGIKYKVKKFEENHYSLQILQEDEVFNVTKFDLNKCYEADFEMGHFYSHKNPCAVFVNNLVISMICDDEIKSLVNKDYLKIKNNIRTKVDINSLESFTTILKNDFNVSFNDKEIKFLFDNYIKE